MRFSLFSILFLKALSFVIFKKSVQINEFLRIGKVEEVFYFMKNKTKLIIGKFYLIFVGRPHPSIIYLYDSKHKTYLSIKFGTSRGKHMTAVHPIQKDGKEQYVNNRPFEGTRSDYGDKELVDLKVDERDSMVIEEIKKKKPLRTKKAKKRYK